MNAIYVGTGRPVPLLDLWPSYHSGELWSWVYNASPTQGGSLCGSRHSRAEALANAVRFLVEHGELDALFDALLGWLR